MIVCINIKKEKSLRFLILINTFEIISKYNYNLINFLIENLFFKDQLTRTIEYITFKIDKIVKNLQSNCLYYMIL